MKTLYRRIAALAAVCMLSAAAFAADLSGTWKWTVTRGRGGSTPREVTLTLVEKDGKLTGKMAMPARDGATAEIDIKNAVVKDDTVSFEIEREFGGNKFVTKYSGKLAGDTITGKSQRSGRDGEVRETEWAAKREAKK